MRRGLVVGGALLALLVPVVVATAQTGQTTPPLRLVKVPSKAEHAVVLAQAPGEPNRHYIVDKNGRVYVTERGKVRARPFLDVRRLITAGGEQGLLGFAFHPGYARNRLFYVAYTSAAGRNVVARFRSNGTVAIPSTRTTLLSVPDPYGNHNGGNLAFGPDGRLYTTIGDGGSGGDPENRSQDMSSQFGKLLRLNVARPGATWEIAALGLRNAWRFTFDRRTGDLWIGDVGQGEIEEIDYVPRGESGLLNFGWDVYEGTRSFEDKPLGPGKLVQPVHQYSHNDGCSVTGGFVYRGCRLPGYHGTYFYGDFCSGLIRSFRLENGRAVDARDWRPSLGRGVNDISSFGVDGDGEGYIVDHDGEVYKIVPAG
jgi:glucose/arabinose dehydrogenase